MLLNFLVVPKLLLNPYPGLVMNQQLNNWPDSSSPDPGDGRKLTFKRMLSGPEIAARPKPRPRPETIRQLKRA